MATLIQDLKFSLRLLLKTPGFTLTAIAVLALGIGVNTGARCFDCCLHHRPPDPSL